MKSKLTKYGLMIVAAVLMIAVAFAGAASAEVKYGGTLDEVQTDYYITQFHINKKDNGIV